MAPTHIHDIKVLESAIASTAGLIVVDFTASWCPPCRMIAPIYDELSDEFASVKFFKVYEHECGEAVEKFGIRGFPTFKFFKGGKQVDEIVGADVDGLRRLLNKHK